jgi:hypothetical protein
MCVGAGMNYQYYFDLGCQAARAGNYWLTSCPFTSWQGEAWKDGNFSVQRGRA